MSSVRALDHPLHTVKLGWPVKDVDRHPYLRHACRDDIAGQMADFDPDPLPIECHCGLDGGTAATKQVQNHVPRLRTHRDDSFKYHEGLLRLIAKPFCPASLE